MMWTSWVFSHDGVTSANHSLLSNESNSALLHGTAVRVSVLCLLLPIPIFAILGNILIMASVGLFRNLQTPTNAFVVSLAIADFLVAVLVMPFSLVRSVDTWRFGPSFCTAHFLLDVTFSTSSIFNLSCVALDRYVAVCDPLHYPARMSPRRVAFLLLLCWLLSFLYASISVLLGRNSLAPPGGSLYTHQACVASFQPAYAVAASIVCFFLPVGFMLFAYGRIFMVAQRQARWIHAMEHQAGQLQAGHNTSPDPTRGVLVGGCTIRKERKAARTLGLIMGVFLLCWCPFFCVNLTHPLWGYRIDPLVLEIIMWLGHINSSLNPFLYASFNKNFRHAFVSILGCGILGRQLEPPMGSRPAKTGERALETISK